MRRRRDSSSSSSSSSSSRSRSRSRSRSPRRRRRSPSRRRRSEAAPPWLAGTPYTRPESLGDEVRRFAAWARPTAEEARARKGLERRVAAEARALWSRSTCEAYGSSSTGADWFLSDLDFRVAVNEPMTFLSPARASEELSLIHI